MLNIHDLEKRWLQYKIKLYMPYAALVLSLILIITAAIFFLNDDEINKQTKSSSKNKVIETVQKAQTPQEQNQSSLKNKEIVAPVETKTQQVKEKESIIANEPLYQAKTQKIQQSNTELKKNSSTHILKPSMDFMKDLQSSTPQYYQARPVKEKSQTIVQTTKKVKTKEKKITKKRQEVSKQKTPQEEYIDVTAQEPVVEEETQKPKEKKIQITIKRRESENDIKEVIRRFQKNNNPALSLFVAKKYYELGNYKQAYNYALVTNKINNDIEESWLIFAKSLVKLGKKEQAIKTLREYIKFSHSANAQVLLDEIQRGKFQ